VELPPKEGVFPTIKAGNRDELVMISNELGISNHSNSEKEWVKTKIVNNSISWEDKKVGENTVPDVIGLTLKDAIYILENMGFKVEIKGMGRVAVQSVTPGKRYNNGDIIKLELG